MSDNRVFLRSIIESFIDEAYVEKPPPPKEGEPGRGSPIAAMLSHAMKQLRKQGIKPAKGERGLMRVSGETDDPLDTSGIDNGDREEVRTGLLKQFKPAPSTFQTDLVNKAVENPNSDERIQLDYKGRWYFQANPTAAAGFASKILKHRTPEEYPEMKTLGVRYLTMPKQEISDVESGELVPKLTPALGKCLLDRSCKQPPEKRFMRFIVPPEQARSAIRMPIKLDRTLIEPRKSLGIKAGLLDTESK